MTDLKILAAAAIKDGWAAGSGDVESIRQQAASLGWVEIAPGGVIRPSPCYARQLPMSPARTR